MRIAGRLLAALAALVLAFSCAALRVEPALPGMLERAGNASIERLGPEGDAPWTVLVLSDIQDGFHYLPALFERGADFDPTAVLILGDIAKHPGRAHLQLPVREMQLHGVPAPLFVVPGNHDVRGVGLEPFVEWFGGTEFSFSIGRTRFVGADNGDTGTLTPEGFARLRAELEAAARRGERVVLILHKNVIDVPHREKEGGWRRVEHQNAELRALIRAHDVPLLLAGDSHWPFSRDRDGTRFVIAPASGDRNDGQTPVSLLVLRYDGREYRLDQHQVYRRNATELATQLLYISLAIVQPLFAERPVAMWSLWTGAALYCIAFLGAGARRRQRGARA